VVSRHGLERPIEAILSGGELASDLDDDRVLRPRALHGGDARSLARRRDGAKQLLARASERDGQTASPSSHVCENRVDDDRSRPLWARRGDVRQGPGSHDPTGVPIRGGHEVAMSGGAQLARRDPHPRAVELAQRAQHAASRPRGRRRQIGKLRGAPRRRQAPELSEHRGTEARV